MRSATKLILLLGTAWLVSGCASSNRELACAELAAPLLGRSVGSAVLGSSGDPALDWQLFGVEQTGRLQQAERDKTDGLTIMQRCEALRSEARARRWWR